jgi:hypothetical protein
VSLPRSLASIFGEKLWALLPALLPSFALLATAVGVGGHEWVAQFVSSLFSNRPVSPADVCLRTNGSFGHDVEIVETIWYLHLVVYLSLRMRWTALPAAYGSQTPYPPQATSLFLSC